MQVCFLAGSHIPDALAQHFKLKMQPAVTLKPEDCVVAMAACGCAQVRRRGCFRGCKGIRRGLELQILADNPTEVVRCQLCDNKMVSQGTKDIAAAIKEHVDSMHAVQWLCVAEMQLELENGSCSKKADLVLIPKHAQTLKSAVAVEIDPPLHFENPTRYAVRQRRGVSDQEAAREAAMQRDRIKDEVYKQLEVWLVRIARGAWLEGDTLTDTFWQMFDQTLTAALAAADAEAA